MESKPAERLSAALSGQRDPEAIPRTQTELARRLGVSTSAVNAWVKGHSRPRLDYAVEIEKLYGIPVAEWVGRVA